MMRRWGLGIGAAIALVCAVHGSAWAQFRMGYVDANVIVQNMPEFKQADAQIQAARGAYEDTLRAMQTSLQREVESYKRDVGAMTPEARDQAQAKLNAMQAELNEYQQGRFGPAGTLAALQEQLLGPIRKRALEATEQVARQEKLAAVLDLSSFIYVDKKINVNVTYKVLEYLSAQEK